MNVLPKIPGDGPLELGPGLVQRPEAGLQRHPLRELALDPKVLLLLEPTEVVLKREPISIAIVAYDSRTPLPIQNFFVHFLH